jgi:hypothetical protein
MGTLACFSFDTFADDIGRLRESLPDVANEIAGFTGIGQVMDWMVGRGADRPAVDLIAMDEFEYDFLVELEAVGRWLAFGVT